MHAGLSGIGVAAIAASCIGFGIFLADAAQGSTGIMRPDALGYWVAGLFALAALLWGSEAYRAVRRRRQAARGGVN